MSADVFTALGEKKNAFKVVTVLRLLRLKVFCEFIILLFNGQEVFFELCVCSGSITDIQWNNMLYIFIHP